MDTYYYVSLQAVKGAKKYIWTGVFDNEDSLKTWLAEDAPRLIGMGRPLVFRGSIITEIDSVGDICVIWGSPVVFQPSAFVVLTPEMELVNHV